MLSHSIEYVAALISSTVAVPILSVVATAVGSLLPEIFSEFPPNAHTLLQRMKLPAPADNNEDERRGFLSSANIGSE